MRTVYIVISCDVDPDRERLLKGVAQGQLGWRGVNEGIPALKEAVRGVTDSARREPVFTWFLRADDQIRQVFGAYGWFARAHASLLRSLEESGDELAWHPHVWRRESEAGPWFQEVEDLGWQVEMLQGAHADLSAAVPRALQSVRMGWSYHNNRTLEALDALGIAVDLSAIPGYQTLRREPPTRGENLFDWHTTPRWPYHPSRVDYRRPAADGEASARLLEVPCFVSSALLWSLVGSLQLARKTGDLGHVWSAIRRPTYCINVTARPPYFAPLVTQLGRSLRGPGSEPLVFETHFHADELVVNRSKLYTLESVRANIDALVRACERAAARVEFVAARRIPAVWPA